MTFCGLCLTGGLHMDGLMDTCDAVFSRKDLKTRLEILSDTHVGAFAVMGCVVLLLLKTALFAELFASDRFFPSVILALIPVYSRIGLGLLCYQPFAREEGLARTLVGSRVCRDRFALWGIYAVSAAFFVSILGLKGCIVPLAGGAFFLIYVRYCLEAFGGITGDLMGAFVELAETLMLFVLVVERG